RQLLTQPRDLRARSLRLTPRLRQRRLRALVSLLKLARVRTPNRLQLLAKLALKTRTLLLSLRQRRLRSPPRLLIGGAHTRQLLTQPHDRSARALRLTPRLRRRRLRAL